VLIVRRALQLVQRAVTSADLKRSASTVLCGITVYHATDRFSPASMYSAVHTALLFLEAHDSRRLKAARRYLRCIVVAAQPHTVYWRHSRACALSDVQLSRQPPAWIASGIVHESVHARLHSLGFAPSDVDQRRRQESVCVAEEIRFLAKVPHSEAIIAHLRAELESGDWYGDSARRRQTVGRLIALNAPEWLIRWFERRV